MTRMEHRRQRTNTLEAIIGALCVGLLLGGMLPPFDPDHFKTMLAVIGAVASASYFVRFVVWLDRR